MISNVKSVLFVAKKSDSKGNNVKAEKTNLGRALSAYGSLTAWEKGESRNCIFLYREADDEKTPGSVHESKLQGPCGVRMDSTQVVTLTDYNNCTK